MPLDGLRPNNEGTIARMVKTEFTIGLGRIITIAGIPILLGISGFFGNHLYTVLDNLERLIRVGNERTQQQISEIKATAAVQAYSIQSIRDSINSRALSRDGELKDIRDRIADHETRLRTIEHSPTGLTGPR